MSIVRFKESLTIYPDGITPLAVEAGATAVLPNELAESLESEGLVETIIAPRATETKDLPPPENKAMGRSRKGAQPEEPAESAEVSG